MLIKKTGCEKRGKWGKFNWGLEEHQKGCVEKGEVWLGNRSWKCFCVCMCVCMCVCVHKMHLWHKAVLTSGADAPEKTFRIQSHWFPQKSGGRRLWSMPWVALHTHTITHTTTHMQKNPYSTSANYLNPCTIVRYVWNLRIKNNYLDTFSNLMWTEPSESISEPSLLSWSAAILEISIAPKLKTLLYY